jgi:hypothetical protein
MRSLLAFALLAAQLAFGDGAAAQPAPTGADNAVQVAVAKALLEEGKKLMAQGLFKEAKEKLEASVQRDPTSEALLELAGCQEKLGATASAWGTLRRAEERARTRGDKKRAEAAATRAAALEPKLPHVTVMVTVTDTQPEVTLDDHPLEKEAWAVALPLDPGQHAVGARSKEGQLFSKTFELRAEESQVVVVPDLTPQLTPPEIVPPKPGEVLPTYRNPYPPQPSIHKPSAGVDPPRVAILTLSIVSVTHLALALGLVVGPGKLDKNLGIAALTIASVGVASGGAALIVWGVNRNKGSGFLSRAPVQVAPFVARSGGGLSLQATF